MSTSLPDLMTRKRRVPGKRIFNAANVLADFIPCSGTPTSYYRQAFQQIGTSHLKVSPAGCVNRDNPHKVGFLYENPRFINEPICFANTKSTDKKQSDWWTQCIANKEKLVPQYKPDTVFRSDYKVIVDPPVRATRFSSKPQQNITGTQGIVPNINSNSLHNERISFQHQFDCRTGRKERGKLHGSFVWDLVSNESRQKQQKPYVDQRLLRTTMQFEDL